MRTALRPASIVVVLLVAAALPAQQLRVNGTGGHRNVQTGAVLNLEFQGSGGQPHVWVFNTSPGPTVVFGETIPVLLDANMIEIGGLAPLPPSGIRLESIPVAANPALHGLTLFSAGAVVDPAAPAGFVVTNGISFTFVGSGADAGPDAAVLTGQSVTLDGSGNLVQGQIPAGTTFHWTVIAGPAGSSPVLAFDQSPFPTFTTDAPGTYLVELLTQGAQGPATDWMSVTAWNISFTSPVDGGFVTAPQPVTGTVTGPAPAAFEVNGAPVAINGGGSFSAPALPMSALMHPITARATAPNGAWVEKSIVCINSPSADLTAFGTPGSVIRIGGVTLDALEPPVETLLASIPLNTIVTAIPPLPLNLPFFSTTITFTGATYDPAVDFDIYPASGAIGIAITYSNLAITSTLTGAIFGIPYSETGTISAASVVINGELQIGSNAQGAMEVTVANSSAAFNGFAFTVTGVLGGLTQLGAIQALMQTALETAFGGVMSLIPSAINPLLAGIVLSLDMSGSGIPVRMDFPFNTIAYDTNGIAIANNWRVEATSVSPTAPVLTHYASTPGVVPGFGATTPLNALPFDFAFGINDDMINQVLAQLVRAGALDLDIQSSLGTGGGAIPLTAGALALILPGAGFEAFDPSVAVNVQVRHSAAPAVVFSTSGAASAHLWLGNLLLSFEAEPVAGQRVPVLSTSVTADTSVAIAIDPVSGTLTITPGTPVLATSVRSVLAGRDPTAALAGLPQVVQQIIPLLTGALTQIPLPGAGLGSALIPEISVHPAATDLLVSYFDLP